MIQVNENMIAFRVKSPLSKAINREFPNGASARAEKFSEYSTLKGRGIDVIMISDRIQVRKKRGMNTRGTNMRAYHAIQCKIWCTGPIKQNEFYKHSRSILLIS